MCLFAVTDGFSKVAQESTTVLLPANPADPAAMVGAAMGVLKGVGSVAGTPGVIEACVLHLPHAFHMPATQPPLDGA